MYYDDDDDGSYGGGINPPARIYNPDNIHIQSVLEELHGKGYKNFKDYVEDSNDIRKLYKKRNKFNSY